MRASGVPLFFLLNYLAKSTVYLHILLFGERRRLHGAFFHLRATDPQLFVRAAICCRTIEPVASKMPPTDEKMVREVGLSPTTRAYWTPQVISYAHSLKDLPPSES